MNLTTVLMSGDWLLERLRQVGALPAEFAELARSREKAGDAAGAKAFYSCAARVAELFNAPAAETADDALYPQMWERGEDGRIREVRHMSQPRRYFATAVNAETGEPVLTREIRATTWGEASALAIEEARRAAGGVPVRLTGLTEEPDPRESHFLRSLGVPFARPRPHFAEPMTDD